MSDQTPRWKYRFANYRRAYTLLREALDQGEPLSQLEKEGLIQRFEYSTELAWKTLRDYLECEGLVLEQITPRTVIRSAFEAGIISQGETWQKALDARNLMSHTYDLKVFEQVIADIRSSYLSAFEELYDFLATKDMGGDR
jgi:nucleotidyltransferase substrate binding protein (TIGR01987 family)